MTSVSNTNSLRDQLVGAWELVEYFAWLPNDPSNIVWPMGRDARGIIMYTPCGHMSAQLLVAGQKPFDRQRATQEELALMGQNYDGYTGHFYLDERGDEHGRPILLHHMHTASYPTWLGSTQRRIMRFVDEEDGKYLWLSVDGTKDIDGEQREIRVRWKKMPENRAPTPLQ